MALVDWYILSMVCLAGAASPGPSWILLVNSVVKDGRKAGIAFGIAHGLGIFVYAALVAFGLVILISIAPRKLFSFDSEEIINEINLENGGKLFSFLRLNSLIKKLSGLFCIKLVNT